jgi:acyl-CoA thioester hydrolase
MITVHQGVAHPWTCDVLGHMTTRFYVAMFDDASYHFLHQVFGWKGNQDDAGKLGWVDVRHVVDYQAEVAAGNLLEVRAGLKKIGTKSITVVYEMLNLSTGDIAASQISTSVLFDLQDRVGVVIPDEIRALASKHLILDAKES